MRVRAENGFIQSVFLAGVVFALDAVGLEFPIIGWLSWALLAVAAVCLALLLLEARTLHLSANRFRKHVVGWLIAAMAAVMLWSLAREPMQDAVPLLKVYRKLWDVFEPFALFAAALFVLIALAMAITGTLDRTIARPCLIERTFVVNLPAKIAAIPMAFTALGVFVIATLWTVYHSFTSSRLLPRSDFVGLDQYDRLWSTERWYISIKNLAIYGICSMVFSLVIGFVLAAMLDRKIRFENTFRTILLYPFALSFIVTGLVWQWLLTPDFGIQKIVRGMGWEGFRFDPLFDSDMVIYGIVLAGLWQGTGFVMVLMLAGLRGIDQEIWKAARVDGIPMWKTYVFIVIPMMRPVFVTTLVIIAAGIIRVYDLVVAMTSGGPGLASEVPAKYVYDYMFGGQNLGQGFAASTMMLLSVLVVLIPFAILEFGERKRG